MKNSKRYLSDKGSGMYYVMVILMVISLLFSGVAYLSLNTAVMTGNSIVESSDYIECDSALNKVLGTLRAYFVDDDISSLSGTEQKNYLFSIKGLADEYYYPLSGTEYHIEAILEQPESPDGEQVFIKGNLMDNNVPGFEAIYELENGRSGRIVIKDVTAEKGSVSVSTDIVLKVENGKVKEIVFDHYNVTTISPDTASNESSEEDDES